VDKCAIRFGGAVARDPLPPEPGKTRCSNCFSAASSPRPRPSIRSSFVPRNSARPCSPGSTIARARATKSSFVDPAGTAEAIAERVRQQAKTPGMRFVVLVGDAEPNANAPAVARARCVPTHVAQAKVNVHWGSEPTLITDNPYGDFDGDGVPEAAVGRLTADTPAELRAMIDKTIAYERSPDYGLWRRQVNCVAGVGGFGILADAIIESSAQYFITQNIPAAYRVSMTYGSWRSPYCPDPRQFHQAALDRFNEGSWFWVYIGHGQRFGLDWVRMPDNYYPIFNREHVGKLKCQHGATLALFLACYIGAFDASDCFGEDLLRQPGGPVAVLAGSRVTMPYAMATMSVGLMDEVFENQCPTLGEAMLRAKKAMLQPADTNDSRRKTLDMIAAGLSPSQKLLDDERAEHVLLFNILGDPLLRLKYPQAVRVETAASVQAGTSLTVSARRRSPAVPRSNWPCRAGGSACPRPIAAPIAPTMLLWPNIRRRIGRRMNRRSQPPRRASRGGRSSCRSPCRARPAATSKSVSSSKARTTVPSGRRRCGSSR